MLFPRQPFVLDIVINISSKTKQNKDKTKETSDSGGTQVNERGTVLL